MSVFDLHAGVLADYRDFVRSFINVADPRARETIENALSAGALWPDPLLQLSPSYARADTVDELADRGDLHRDTAEVFRNADREPFRLYRHQEQPLALARTGRSYVVTSGTGSGKSLTYFLPIVDSAVRGVADNRQDASLQAGHFNDFVHVGLLRSALHAALVEDGELGFDRVTDAVVAGAAWRCATSRATPSCARIPAPRGTSGRRLGQ